MVNNYFLIAITILFVTSVLIIGYKIYNTVRMNPVKKSLATSKNFSSQLN